MRTGIAVVLAASLAVMSGCATLEATGQSQAGVQAVPADVLIAQDFARAIVQVPSLQPAVTTIRFNPAPDTGDRFLGALQTSLRQAGYAIQITPETDWPNQVSHTVQSEAEPGGSTFQTHVAGVGSVMFRRQYRIDRAGNVSPASALFVKGADASGLVMDDSLFDQPGTQGPHKPDGLKASPPRQAVAADEAGTRPVVPQVVPIAIPPKPILPRLPLAASISSPLISQAQASARANQGGGLTTVSARVGSVLPYTGNVFELGQSNFDDLLGDYRDVDERILVFGNDSMRLGNQNKKLIDTMVKQFDKRHDVISLVGCSLGPTRIENGNQTLALGRANRVKEALVLAGVPQDRILDEGCWAGQSDRRMPSRGVVITHRRERG